MTIKEKYKVRKNRTKPKGSTQYPIVLVTRSNKNLVAQIINGGKILGSVSTNKISKGTKTEKAVVAGELLSKVLKEKNFSKIVFNRNGLLYHGRVKAFADSLRTNKITF